MAFLMLYVCASHAQTASFTVSQNTKCVPSTATLTNTSIGTVVAVDWDFGDNSTHYTQLSPSPQHPYDNPGVYVITLIVTFAGNVKDTAKQVIEVYTKPIFTFFAADDSICAGESIQFTSAIAQSNGIRSYFWDFGDGLSSSQASPLHYYNNNVTRKYNVSLTVVDTNGCDSIVSFDNYIAVGRTPQADFTTTDTFFCVGNNAALVHFTNTSADVDSNTYIWDFGDNSMSYAKSPTHTYVIGNQPASYDITLIARSPYGCADTVTYKNKIRIGAYTPHISVSDTIFCYLPASVLLMGLDAGATYTWTIDTNKYISTNKGITYEYYDRGEKTIYLTAVSSEGCIGYDTVHIHIYKQDTAKIQIDMDGCFPDFEFTFTNATQYLYNDDFGMEQVLWMVENRSDTVRGDTAKTHYNHYISCLYPKTVFAIVTTPYGCVLPLAMETYCIDAPVVSWNAITDSTDLCGPHEVCFYNFYRFYRYERDSMDMNLTIYWDYEHNLDDTAMLYHFSYYDTICHYYDTGEYVMCVFIEDTCLIYREESFEFGYKPLVNFSYNFVQDCYSDFAFDVNLYDSVDANGNLVARTKHNRYWWFDPDHPDEVVLVDGPKVTVPHLGLQRLGVLTTHYNCPSDTVIHDSVAYICPPGIDYNATLPAASDYILCDTTKLLFQPVYYPLGDATSSQWYFGDDTILAQQTTTGLIPSDSAVTFDFRQTKNNALYTQRGYFVNTLIAINDDSVDIYSPTYNRCKYCEDTAFKAVIISVAEPSVSDSLNVCRGTRCVLYDSSICNSSFLYWGFKLVNTQDVTDVIKLDTIRMKNKIRHELNSSLLKGGTTYQGLIYDEDSVGCERAYPVNLFIHPSSKPAFKSSTDSIDFHTRQEVFCANSPDTFYLKDESYTEAPYDSTVITNRRWIIFDDTSYAANPVFVSDTNAGYYNVRLTITNEYDCESTINSLGYILIKRVFPEFIPDKHVICNTDDVIFTNNSYVDPSDDSNFVCLWDFGDSTTLVTIGNAKVKHHYSYQPGMDTIIVSLTVTCADIDCYEMYFDTIYMSNITALFTDTGHVYPCPGSVGRTITFQDSSMGDVEWWKWNFGDSVSGSANEVAGMDMDTVIHHYSHAGYYDITLIVRDNIGCYDTLYMPQYVFIDGPIGDFAYAPLSGCTPLDVVFTPSITNADTFMVNPDGANVIVKGGSMVYDTCSFTYTLPKPYVPYFYLIKWTNHNGKMEQCIYEWRGKDTIWAIQLDADYLSDSLYCPYDPVQLINISTTDPVSAGIDSVWWDFGNGSTSNNYHGTTMYSQGGDYNVSMHVYAKQCDSVVTQTVHVAALPMLEFLPDTISDCGMSEAEFRLQDSTYADSISHYEWLFADGDKSTDYPCQRSFSSSGSYSYEVHVTFAGTECTAIYYDTVNVINLPPPVAEFDATPWVCKYGDPIQFTDLSTAFAGGIKSWYWDFDDNQTDTIPNPSHTYVGVSGEFNVMLKVIDAYDCEDTVIHPVTVLAGLDFPNIYTPDGVCEGLPCVFKPLSDNGYFDQFSMTIYNRWGGIVWKSNCNAPNCPDYDNSFWWDGKDLHGNRVADGVYYWVAKAVPMSGKDAIILNGSVTVVNGE